MMPDEDWASVQRELSHVRERIATQGADNRHVLSLLQQLAAPPVRRQRARRIALTQAGHGRLVTALPLWTAMHACLEAELEAGQPALLRRGLNALSAPAPPVCEQEE